MKVSMRATIPVVQYGNLQPSVELETDSAAEGLGEALEAIAGIWNRVSDKPLTLRDVAAAVASQVDLRCWASGDVVPFDPVAHHYGGPGESWLSGSAFADRYTDEFPSQMIAGQMAKKHGVNSADILDMWAKNAEASSAFGTGIHAALECLGTYGDLSAALADGDQRAKALSKNPTLRRIVESFFDGRPDDERAFYEVFVADRDLMHCGQIDRLRIQPERNHVVVEDFKTNSDIHKKKTTKEPFKGVIDDTELGHYWLQLSFYSRILERHGYIVDGLAIYWWNGDVWETYEHDVIDISEVI